MDGRHIFINAGALFDAKTPNEIIGVFAHETGHLAGGHLMRCASNSPQAQTASIVAMLARRRRHGGRRALRQQRAMSACRPIMAPQSAIQRSLLAYVRTQEDQADHAGVKFLNATDQSARGMLELFKRLSNEMLFNSRYIDPYLQTHPMPPDRVAALEVLAKSSPYFDVKDPPELQLRHDHDARQIVRLPGPARHGRAPLSARRSQPAGALCPRHLDLPSWRFARSAVAQIDGLIQAEPNNPYFYELKGQALLEGGHPAEAIAPLRRAVALAHGAPLIDIMLGQALIATNNTKIRRRSRRRCCAPRSAREPEAPDAYAQLAMAYGRKGDLANADLAAAQAAFNRGDIKTARQLAARAKTRLPVGSPAWVRPTISSTSNARTPKTNDPQTRTKPMTSSPRLIAAVCAALLADRRAASRAGAEFLAARSAARSRRIVRDYLVAHPEVLQEAMAELEKRQAAAEAEKHKAAVKEHAQALFSSPNQVTLGNPNGNVTFVEFFDYNCGYCKRAMNDMLTLLKDDPKLKVVLKEFPVLGPGSVEAAQVAVAVRMQDKTGKKYLEFHQKLLGGRGQADKAHALAVAKDIGLDMGRLEKDMDSPEVKATLERGLQARRSARPQRHAELCDRRRRGGRRHRPARLAGKDQHRALRQADLLTAAQHSR